MKYTTIRLGFETVSQQHAVHATLFMQSLSRAHQNYCYQASQREAVPAMCIVSCSGKHFFCKEKNAS